MFQWIWLSAPRFSHSRKDSVTILLSFLLWNQESWWWACLFISYIISVSSEKVSFISSIYGYPFRIKPGLRPDWWELVKLIKSLSVVFFPFLLESGSPFALLLTVTQMHWRTPIFRTLILTLFISSPFRCYFSRVARDQGSFHISSTVSFIGGGL